MPESNPSSRPRPRRRRLAVAAVLVAAAAAIAAAAATAASHAGSARSSTAALQLRSTSLGKVLVNANGRTLYMYTLDKSGKSVCYTSCASFWPPMLSKTSKPTLGAGVKRSLVGVTKRKNGKLQVTYHGHPLYTFLADKKAGAVGGQGYQKRWYVLNASGAVIKKAAGGSPPPTTTSGGGGGWG